MSLPQPLSLLTTTYGLSFAALVLTWALLKTFKKRSRLPYPPGPKPSAIPLLGNVADMPSTEEWKTYTEWGRQYGPLVMVEVLGQRILIINSQKVATELLDARSAIYSDRPEMPMVNDLMDWRFNMGMQPYSENYKKHRKAFHHGFNRRTSDEYHEMQTREVTVLIQNLLNDPGNYGAHLKDSVAAAIMMIGLGYKTTGSDDEFVRIAEEAQDAMSEAARPGAYLVNVMPWLKYIPEWMPGATFKTVGRRGWKLSQELQTKPFDWAMQQYKRGEALPGSFFKKLMEARGFACNDDKEEMHIIRCASSLMYATGADTILSSILIFLLGVLHSPHVLKIAHEEIDRVVGNDRLPTYADKEALPYVTAIVKEALRWESVVPFGVPHRLMQDDTYEGYFIPAGTMVLVNQWGISHDESMYPNSMEFKPERFMVPQSEKPLDPNNIGFGYGRRICPGRFVAENQLWLTVATILACFDISPAIDADGKPIIPPRKFTVGLACRPLPFPCVLKPRSGAVKEMVAHSVEALH